MTDIKGNPHLFYTTKEPMFSEDEGWFIYAVTGLHPQHFDIEGFSEWIGEAESPIDRLINHYIRDGNVMVFDYDEPFAGETTQDFVKRARHFREALVFRVDEGVRRSPKRFRLDEIRSVLTLAQKIAGQEVTGPVPTRRFLDYLVKERVLAPQAVELCMADELDPDLQPHQIFHDARDFRPKFFFPNKVTVTDEFDEAEDVICTFRKAQAQSVEGHIAFTEDQTRQLLSEGKAVIDVRQAVTLDEFEFLGTLSTAVVICEEQNEGDAHLLDHLIGFPVLAFSEGEHQLTLEGDVLRYGDKKLGFGDHVVVDIQNKRLITGNAAAEVREPHPELSKLFTGLCDEYRSRNGGFKIMGNVSTGQEAMKVAEADTDGIGLIRTEYQLLSPQKLSALRRVVMENDPSAVQEIHDYQKKDCAALFDRLKDRDGFDITIRLVDLKPSEFLDEEQQRTLKDKTGVKTPRGVQVSKTAPELYKAQAEAICEALGESEFQGTVKILVPYVSTGSEMASTRELIVTAAEKSGVQEQIKAGSMLETFNALSNIGDIVPHADFANIGPKDLTLEFLGGLRAHQENEIKAFMKKLHEDDEEDIPWQENWPYQHLHPGIQKPLGKAVGLARKLKPDFDVVLCGDEMYGSEETLTFATEHLQGISVPLHSQTIARTKFLVANRIYRQTTPFVPFWKQSA